MYFHINVLALCVRSRQSGYDNPRESFASTLSPVGNRDFFGLRNDAVRFRVHDGVDFDRGECPYLNACTISVRRSGRIISRLMVAFIRNRSSKGVRGNLQNRELR